ncbi:transposase domain-containing protein [Streptomyces sp. NPDC057623]|uniref:transposase domain-containing protein n=1 Tax=Streptomyces sp. NPDC057623 TaxID=3346187 RepID=UPI0036817988
MPLGELAGGCCCVVVPGVVSGICKCRRVVGLGLLTWVYPPGLVDRVMAACGRAEHRKLLLPARLVMCFVLAPALFPPAPYLEVMRHLVEGLRGAGLLGEWHAPAKSSLFRARQRLGTEPLRVLFTTTAKPAGTEATLGAFWRGRRLPPVDAAAGTWPTVRPTRPLSAVMETAAGRTSPAFPRCGWPA